MFKSKLLTSILLAALVVASQFGAALCIRADRNSRSTHHWHRSKHHSSNRLNRKHHRCCHCAGLFGHDPDRQLECR